MRDLEKVCIQPKYNYCTGEERFTFIKLPKCLVEDEGFVLSGKLNDAPSGRLF